MSKNVIIIGGGIAGLTAASELHDSHVTLLEARKRFGGRICTIHSGSYTFELGAEFVHGQNKPLLEAIHAAQLATHEASDENQIFHHGQLKPIEVWNNFSELTQKIDPRAQDRSFLSFLDQQFMKETDRRMMLAFVEGFNAADGARISAHSIRRAEYAAEQMEGDVQMRLERGYSDLVDFMAAKARASGATLLTETVVRVIRWSPGQVEVTATRHGKTETFHGDAAIITLPLGVLKSRDVRFEPSLPAHEEAIAGLEFGNVVKMTLLFREEWWPGADFGFIHALEEAFPTWWSDPRGPILTGWAGGPKADALVDHSEEQLKDAAIKILAKIFSVKPAFVEAQLLSVHTHNWWKDPFSRGSYTYIPVRGLFLPKQLAASVDGTLFFAGEATALDAQMGTVFSALESGQRAAKECLHEQAAVSVDS